MLQRKKNPSRPAGRSGLAKGGPVIQVPASSMSPHPPSLSPLDQQRADGPSFDLDVPPGGYAWWYVDALSDDGHQGLTLIAFVGSVFSPYYAWAGRRDPLDHCALNVVLYGRRGSAWAMTERRREAVARTPDTFVVASSSLQWTGEGLQIDLEETTHPWPSRIAGRIRVRPEATNPRRVQLDPAGAHVWWPLAPRSRVDVELTHPEVRWSGGGYFDSNWGSAPLESAFSAWNWSRASVDGGAAILYDVVRRDADPLSVALRVDASGRARDFEAPGMQRLPPTRWWRIARASRSEGALRVERTLEDTPFYARSVLKSELLGQPVEAMHESLSLDRFATGWAKFLVSFRMPRAKR